ncbi:uncharacterized protein MELLADRAFT_56538 [Melampsora larici-populina 98AG31]|uniref:BED-type domain-containing protein n=1 Tax=Melampsora larici-populina (strain 98AG31 / pathotype 3-4-7) TaxID=747676 RepID=F4RRN9_MELLP|nr:uncharacterized protein MELLADRAFT_56538 [Melampsora larici-populina 98AG31]EGG04989.1 hypothetical protein MELLADRAFT_56538 [Melampsora larici-populina 98AG31]
MSNTSFVWDHFEKSEDGTNRCTVVKKNGEICNSALAKDKSSSTKSMIVHLKTQHGIIDPAKKGKHANIDVLMKTGTLEVNVCFELYHHF